jgi:hypothetical protein
LLIILCQGDMFFDHNIVLVDVPKPLYTTHRNRIQRLIVESQLIKTEVIAIAETTQTYVPDLVVPLYELLTPEFMQKSRCVHFEVWDYLISKWSTTKDFYTSRLYKPLIAQHDKRTKRRTRRLSRLNKPQPKKRKTNVRTRNVRVLPYGRPAS